jgi:hypothetical protein
MLYHITAYILDCLVYVYSLSSSCGIRDIEASNPRQKILYSDNVDMPDFSVFASFLLGCAYLPVGIQGWGIWGIIMVGLYWSICVK